MNALKALWAKLTWRQLVLIATATSALFILGAWTFQALGYAPCELCYLQRYPHYVAVPLGLVAVLTRQRWMAWGGALAAATTSGIGFYHSGVERHWWPGPTSCTGGGNLGSLTPDQLLQQLQSAPLVRCDEIPWRLSDLIPWDLLDITMANFNAIGSLVLVFVWIAAARRR